MKNILKGIFPKLFCEHVYKLINEGFLEVGRIKFRFYKCQKCGKTKLDLV